MKRTRHLQFFEFPNAGEIFAGANLMNYDDTCMHACMHSILPSFEKFSHLHHDPDRMLHSYNIRHHDDSMDQHT